MSDKLLPMMEVYKERALRTDLRVFLSLYSEWLRC